MCGIFGVVFKNRAAAGRVNVKDLNNLAAHRGPDDEGYFHVANVHLAHRRLSIIDVSAGGHQPMQYLDRYTVTYNGEIYNYLEVRDELEALGYSFTTHSDTEVILAAYDKWGEACAQRFNGMWAFALYDSDRKQLFLCRDRFGKKPLYLLEHEDYFAFASEIKQLLPLLAERRLDFEITAEFLLHGLIEHTDNTFFEAIKKLPPSSSRLLDCTDFTYQDNIYFHIERQPGLSELDVETASEQYLKLFRRAVQLRLRSDVTVGTCLSGGLDSSSVIAVVCDLLGEDEASRFLAITAQSIESQTDETEFASAVVDRVGARWKTIMPDTEEFIASIDEIVYTQEEPFEGPSIFMQYFVMKQARESGCKVMLDGQGGDETLLGYENYVGELLRNYLQRGQFVRFYRALSNVQGFRLSRSRLALAAAVNLFSGYKTRLRYALRNRMIVNPAKKLNGQKAADRFINGSMFDMQRNELTSKQLPVLLRYEDKNSMRNSVETRLPFLDYQVASFACSLRPEVKISKGYMKYVLRVAIDNLLPASVVWRRTKFGFEAPSNLWLSRIREDMLDTIAESTILREFRCDYPRMSNRELWRYYSVAKWEIIYQVET